ncbi:MAG: hypothetical protein LC808_23930 [Actinobacteria bacterium]|nr:hypothetical protein [Actinomycetota bacterium]
MGDRARGHWAGVRARLLWNRTAVVILSRMAGLKDDGRVFLEGLIAAAPHDPVGVLKTIAALRAALDDLEVLAVRSGRVRHESWRSLAGAAGHKHPQHFFRRHRSADDELRRSASALVEVLDDDRGGVKDAGRNAG